MYVFKMIMFYAIYVGGESDKCFGKWFELTIATDTNSEKGLSVIHFMTLNQFNLQALCLWESLRLRKFQD